MDDDKKRLATYQVLAWVEGDKVRCASQMCDECPQRSEGRCIPALLVVGSSGTSTGAENDGLPVRQKG